MDKAENGPCHIEVRGRVSTLNSSNLTRQPSNNHCLYPALACCLFCRSFSHATVASRVSADRLFSSALRHRSQQGQQDGCASCPRVCETPAAGRQLSNGP